ncbi:hypothetical protein [Paenibacillus arenilitoris]|uniref:Uncharacterized protein n=1 Tax=Paenibacillus arenilitoris TaxID=2772299 RepID=A0A927H863_9BACL|nr:hypothetical protein [Paenibacillus arenilitoris]MBD2870304.1 hypothetical protein [Paenibacillus arenilitoris]
MLIVGTFNHCTELELALSLLERNGIDKSRIMVVPMDLNRDSKSAYSPRIATDAERAFEVGMAFATAMSVIGVSIGFGLKLGPLLWGVIFAFGGFLVSFGLTIGIKRAIRRKRSRLSGKTAATYVKKTNRPELTVLIECEEERAEHVSRILWEHEAISVGRAGHG